MRQHVDLVHHLHVAGQQVVERIGAAAIRHVNDVDARLEFQHFEAHVRRGGKPGRSVIQLAGIFLGIVNYLLERLRAGYRMNDGPANEIADPADRREVFLRIVGNLRSKDGGSFSRAICAIRRVDTSNETFNSVHRVANFRAESSTTHRALARKQQSIDPGCPGGRRLFLQGEIRLPGKQQPFTALSIIVSPRFANCPCIGITRQFEVREDEVMCQPVNAFDDRKAEPLSSSLKTALRQPDAIGRLVSMECEGQNIDFPICAAHGTVHRLEDVAADREVTQGLFDIGLQRPASRSRAPLYRASCIMRISSGAAFLGWPWPILACDRQRSNRDAAAACHGGHRIAAR
jgi:hypothetical protein